VSFNPSYTTTGPANTTLIPGVNTGNDGPNPLIGLYSTMDSDLRPGGGPSGSIVASGLKVSAPRLEGSTFTDTYAAKDIGPSNNSWPTTTTTTSSTTSSTTTLAPDPNLNFPFQYGLTGVNDLTVGATDGISPGLATNIFYEYWRASRPSLAADERTGTTSTPPNETVSAWSPSQRRYYTAYCSEGDGAVFYCPVVGTDDGSGPAGVPAEVSFDLSLVEGYNQSDIDNYTAHNEIGPNG
jgi:hypothetical protein